VRTYTGPCDVLEPGADRRVLPGYRPGPAPGSGIIIHQVRSHSDPSVFYKVREFPDGTFSCDCADFEYRGAERPCKHINGILLKRKRLA